MPHKEISLLTKPVEALQQVRKSAVLEDNVVKPYDDIKIIIENAKSKIGLSPISLAHVRHWSDIKYLDSITDFNKPEFENARICASMDFLETELKFKKDEIKITSAN